MQEKILEEVEKRDKLSGGKCGLTPIELSDILQIPYSELKEPLNELHAQKKITVRNGANSYLLFKV